MSDIVMEAIIIAVSIVGIVILGNLVVTLQGRMVERHLQRLAEKEHPID